MFRVYWLDRNDVVLSQACDSRGEAEDLVYDLVNDFHVQAWTISIIERE